MKVIKRVNPVETFSLQVGCHHCSSILEIDAGDLWYKPGVGDQRDWSPAYFYCRCEVCKNDCSVCTDTIPAFVQDVIRKERTTKR